MYRSIIVDDESIAIKRFEHLASKEERITLLASFTEPTEALSYIKEHPVDIAFLDIEMPGINGLDLAEQLQIQDPFISIIFITAYDHYALDAFQAHALGYLLKPVSLQDFSRQIDSLSRTKTPRKLDTPSMPTKQQADILSVSCLGQFSCMTAAQTPIAFRTAKTAELFALLLHYHGTSITKYFILDTLFPDMDYEKSNKIFYVSCSYLRSTFSKSGYPDLLLRENDSYRLNMSMITCDFLPLINNTARVSNMTLEELISLSACYKGEYLMGRSYEWAFETRTYLQDLYQRMQSRLAAIYLQNGQDNDAIELLKKYLITDPCNEETVIGLLQIYHKNGQHGQALNIYNTYKDKLYELLDTTPSASVLRIIKSF